jgi:hypothetical protein
MRIYIGIPQLTIRIEDGRRRGRVQPQSTYFTVKYVLCGCSTAEVIGVVGRKGGK